MNSGLCEIGRNLRDGWRDAGADGQKRADNGGKQRYEMVAVG